MVVRASPACMVWALLCHSSCRCCCCRYDVLAFLRDVGRGICSASGKGATGRSQIGVSACELSPGLAEAV